MLKTEMRNPASTHIDRMSTLEMLQLINQENMNAVRAVEAATPEIARACNAVAACFEKGGRLFYIGCGTSGRIGVIDAAECPPTYGVPRDQVIGIIAGGLKCMAQAAENEEDDASAGRRDLSAYQITANDAVMGISSAGGAAYVVGALEYARSQGACTISLSSNADTAIERAADIAIITDTGAEVVTGSTRMKSGTAQKLVLNMISTCAMIKTGKVYENMMINLKPSNIKLRERMLRIVCEIKGCNMAEAEQLLQSNDWNIRQAVSKGINSIVDDIYRDISSEKV